MLGGLPQYRWRSEVKTKRREFFHPENNFSLVVIFLVLVDLNKES